MSKISKWAAFLFLILPVITLPLDWYRKIIPNHESFTWHNASGIYVVTQDQMHIILIYLLCVVIERIVMKGEQYAYAILAKVLLLGALFIYPTDYYPITIMKLRYMTIFSWGYYMTSLFILVSIGINMRQLWKAKIDL